MPLTPGRLTSKIRQLGPSSGFLSRNFSAVPKPSDRKPADFSSPCIDARMLASSSTTNTVAVFSDAIASPIVNALPPNEEIPVRDLDRSGNLGNQLLFRDNEPTLEIVDAGRPWSFDGDGSTFASFLKRDRKEEEVTRWTKRSVLF